MRGQGQHWCGAPEVLRTEADYREALSLVDSLWTKAAPGNPEGDQLDVLVTLIQAYEREHHPIPPPAPIEAIKFRVEQKVGVRAHVTLHLVKPSAQLSTALSRTEVRP